MALTVSYDQNFIYESSADGLVATPGGGQANAARLQREINRIATVASIGDSVMLPPSVGGLDILVINHGANAVQVFGSGTDTIDDVASNVGVQQMAGSYCLFACTTAGQWYSNGIGTGFAGQFPTLSYTSAITATPAGTQATAVLIATALNRVTTVATAGDAVKLPVAAPGMQITIANTSATNAMNVFPNVGDAINALAANAAFSIPAGKTANLYSMVAGFWHSVLSA